MGHILDCYQDRINRLLDEDPEIDYVIALTHQLIDEDRIMAQNAKYLDLILGGHEHEPFLEVHNDVPVVKVGMDAQSCGVVTIIVNQNKEANTSYEIYDMRNFVKQDPYVQTIHDKQQAYLKAI